MPQGIVDEMLPVIKGVLHYAWSDTETEERLSEMIRDGMAYLQRLAAGNVLTYEEGTAERRLLKSYCLYANSDALEDFLPRYLHELSSFQLDQEVAYEIRQQEAATTE